MHGILCYDFDRFQRHEKTELMNSLKKSTGNAFKDC